MGWHIVEYQKCRGARKLPVDGVRITPSGTDPKRRYIVIGIGASLARKLLWSGSEVTARLMIGTANDQDRLAISADAGGAFTAHRNKFGDYRINVNTTSAAGLFNLGVEAFNVDTVEIAAANVQNAPRRAIVECPAGFILPPIPAVRAA